MIIKCLKCGKERNPDLSKVNIETYKKQYPTCRRCSAFRVKDKISKGWFKAGVIPWNKNKVGVMPPAWNKGMKGTHFSPKTEFKKGQKSWNKGKPFIEYENHWNWRGDKVGYNALHSWVKRKLGKANKCAECDGKRKSKRFEWANISGKYKRELSDWKMLCSKCHHKFDNISKRGWKTRKKQYSTSVRPVFSANTLCPYSKKITKSSLLRIRSTMS